MEFDKLYTGKKCPYCGGKVVFTTNDKVYGKMLGNGMIYMCTKCMAYVGCHPDGRPLGRLADRELRRMRKEAHDMFDPLWKEAGVSRGVAYAWLAQEMKLTKQRCHFSKFSNWEMMCATSILVNRPRKQIINEMRQIETKKEDFECYMSAMMDDIINDQD